MHFVSARVSGHSFEDDLKEAESFLTRKHHSVQGKPGLWKRDTAEVVGRQLTRLEPEEFAKVLEVDVSVLAGVSVGDFVAHKSDGRSSTLTEKMVAQHYNAAVQLLLDTGRLSKGEKKIMRQAKKYAKAVRGAALVAAAHFLGALYEARQRSESAQVLPRTRDVQPGSNLTAGTTITTTRDSKARNVCHLRTPSPEPYENGYTRQTDGERAWVK
ncbi:hypothetical protein HK101_011737, partial [Irineochytrium annulatum]